MDPDKEIEEAQPTKQGFFQKRIVHFMASLSFVTYPLALAIGVYAGQMIGVP